MHILNKKYPYLLALLVPSLLFNKIHASQPNKNPTTIKIAVKATQCPQIKGHNLSDYTPIKDLMAEVKKNTIKKRTLH